MVRFLSPGRIVGGKKRHRGRPAGCLPVNGVVDDGRVSRPRQACQTGDSSEPRSAESSGPCLAGLRRFVLIAADVATALQFEVGHLIVAVKTSHSVHGPEASTVDDCLDPFKALVADIHIMTLVHAQANLRATVVTLNVEEKTFIIRA